MSNDHRVSFNGRDSESENAGSIPATRTTLDVVNETSGAHPDKRPNRIRTRGPGKGKRAECVLLLDIAIQALQTAKEAAVLVRTDMPTHERVRLLVPVLSDAGLAMRSVAEAVERWEAGKV